MAADDSRVALGRDDLPGQWDSGDPSALVEDHASHVAALSESDPAYGAFFDRAARGLAGAKDAAELDERHVVVLGRERGLITDGLSSLPKLPLEVRKVHVRQCTTARRAATGRAP